MLTTIEKQEIKNVDGLNFFSDRQMRQFDEMEKQLNESKKQLNESKKQLNESEKQRCELEKQRCELEKQLNESDRRYQILSLYLKSSGMDEDAMNRLIYSRTKEEKIKR